MKIAEPARIPMPAHTRSSDRHEFNMLKLVTPQGQIAMLEQENQSLRNQLEQARQQAAQGNDWANAWGGSSMNERVLMEENTALKVR